MSERVKVQKHLLYKDSRKQKVENETNCSNCIHVQVCDHRMNARCVNYVLEESNKQDCLSCANHFARLSHEEWVPCFLCSDFQRDCSSTIKALIDAAEASCQEHMLEKLGGLHRSKAENMLVDALIGIRKNICFKRDPESECEEFELGDVVNIAHCETDGHYLCAKCIHNTHRLEEGD